MGETSLLFPFVEIQPFIVQYFKTGHFSNTKCECKTQEKEYYGMDFGQDWAMLRREKTLNPDFSIKKWRIA